MDKLIKEIKEMQLELESQDPRDRAIFSEMLSNKRLLLGQAVQAKFGLEPAGHKAQAIINKLLKEGA